ncbi:MAG: GNAT family N-acetyltransferase [Cyanobacteria bacterium P01_D01_bin.50]
MSTVEIKSLDTKDTEKIIEIFSSAFEKYPLMQFLFGDAYKQSIKHLIELMCHEVSVGDGFFLGGFAEGKLQGIAFVTPPEKANNDRDAQSKPTPSEEEFARLIGEEALIRVEGYLNLKKANKPNQPHFYINALAVDPQSQKKGIGRALLSQVHKISEENFESRGVALDTQTQNNVDYYQHFGYGINSTAELQSIQNWFMFRPDVT